MSIELLCECNGLDCDKTMEMSLEDAQKIDHNLGLVIIVDGCVTGPDATDTLFEIKSGYSIYQEQG